jgi:hypothetical protein
MAGGGMLKSYLKYVPSATVGVIGSPASNVLWDSTGKRALVAALGDVMAWNLATGEWRGGKRPEDDRVAGKTV